MDEPRISDAEWQVMQVVWERKAATAAEVIAALAGRTGWQHRTIRTLLARLVDKGVLAALETALACLAHAGWQAAVLGLLVLLLSRALRGRLEPRWRYGLWLVVLARLALPVAPPAPWSLFRLVPAGASGRSAPDRPVE